MSYLTKLSIIALVFLCASQIVSFAAPVTITSNNYQTEYGLVSFIEFVSSSDVSSPTPSTNMASAPPSSYGSFNLTRGSSAYFWIATSADPLNVSAGTWVLNLWVEGLSSGTIFASIYITSSSGVPQSAVVTNVSTSAIGTTESEISLSFLEGPVVIPSNGFIETVVSAPSDGPTCFKVFWGQGQPSDLQVPLGVQ